ncbi:MAG: TlyA family RNA methyltransferase [Mycoplasma sp.]
MRLDKYLVEKHLVTSRNKAQNLIKKGVVSINSFIITNNHHEVSDYDVVEVKQVQQYVSRGAYKLLAAIENWKIDISNKIVLDIGASTGGFSQVCLNANAKKVYAIDVGSNQIDSSLIKNKRLISYEKTNFKDLNLLMFNEQIDLIVADLSFISLTTLIDYLIQLFNYQYEAIFLIKPQFELGKEIASKFNGVIKDPKLWNKAINKVKQHLMQNNFQVIGVIESPIKGSEGNTEFLVYCKKQ